MRTPPWICCRASCRFNDLHWDAEQEGGPGIEAATALPPAGDLSYRQHFLTSVTFHLKLVPEVPTKT